MITGGGSEIGSAAAIAFAREGADVAICYLPEEQPDAREVVQLIERPAERLWPFRETFVTRDLRPNDRRCTPYRRAGQPAELAPLYVILAS